MTGVRYRLVLASGKIETIEDPFLIDVSASGALVIYDQRNVLTHAFATGQWHSFEAIEDVADTTDVFGDATKAASG